MKFLKWLMGDPEARGWVAGRSVAIPHYPSVETISNSIENSSSATAVSTLSVTVCLLNEGESAEEVGSRYPRLAAGVMHKTTREPDGCYRLHCNVPNWVRILVKQEEHTIRLHTEVPVWVDPSSGKAVRIDKEKLIESLIPDRDYAIEAWNKGGYFLGP